MIQQQQRHPFGFPMCSACNENVAGFLLGTHAPMCFECVSACDWSRRSSGPPPDVAAAFASIATARALGVDTAAVALRNAFDMATSRIGR